MLLISLNIRGGINSKDKPYKIANYLKNIPFDIALLQEVSTIKPKNKDILEKELNVKIHLKENLKQKHHIGVASLIKNDSKITLKNITYPNIIGEGRIQHLKINAEGIKINLINLYASTHPSDKRSQWTSIGKYVTDLKNLIIIGDFNSTIHREERMGNTDNNRIDNLLVNLIKNNNLTDIASHVNNRTHTYIGYKATSLIDRIIMSDNLKHNFIRYDNLISPHSDHNMITCNMFNPKNIDCRKQKRFRMWKLNNSLLDRQTTDKLAKFWEEWRNVMHNFPSTIEWYIKGKHKIKQILITIGKQRAKERHEENILNSTIKNEMEKQNISLKLRHPRHCQV